MIQNWIRLRHFGMSFFGPHILGTPLKGVLSCEQNKKVFISTKTGVVILHPDGTKEFIRDTFYDFTKYKS